MKTFFKSHSYFSKILMIILAILMVGFPLFSLVSSGLDNGETLEIYQDEKGVQALFTIYGDWLGTSIAWCDIDGKTYPAYCIDPDLPGAGDYGAPDSYDVKLWRDTEHDKIDEKVYGIIVNGYPYKTPAELGVPDAWHAAYATKMAVKTYLKGWHDMSAWGVNAASPDGAKAETLAAMKSIFEAGMQVTEIPIAVVTATPDGGNTPATDDATAMGYLSKTYTVTSNVQIKSYKVSLTSSLTGTKITDVSGNDKTTFNAGEKFKVLIQKDKVTSSGKVTLKVEGEVASNAVWYGSTTVAGTQDYAVTTNPLEFKSTNAEVSYEGETTTEPTTQPTTEPTTKPELPYDPSSRLIIYKYEAGTNKPLAGAVFEIRSASGEVLNVLSTDSSGKAEATLPVGVYSVTELTPPQGYVLDVYPHKDSIIIVEDETTTVTFTNKKQPSLEVQKVDGDTGLPLAGAVIRIAKDGGTDSWDVTTDAQGKATLTGIDPGTYTMTEITAPSGYVLNTTQQIIVLEAGKTGTITVNNWKKPGIVIKKYDEDTGLPLAGAEFSLAKHGGTIVYEGITDATGIIKVENLEPGWYTITEIAAPKGYLIATKSKDVLLEAGTVVEVKFDNRLRPALEILKVDSQTNEPLAGAKFKVQKTENATVSEYITDSDGRILINDLDEAIYSVWETEAPYGYILDEQHKDIALEWGKTKQLIFTNKEKAKLRILKVDAITGEPLAGAEFRVTKVEDKTVSEYITDASGTIIIENLDEAVYKVEEFMPPEGYLLYTESKEIALEWGQTKTLKFDDIRKPTLIITKTNGLTYHPIPNTTFKIEYEAENGGVRTIGTYRTDENGQIILPKVAAGWYIITETAAAPGYSLPSNPVTRKYLAPGENAYTNTNVSGTGGDTSGDNITVMSGSEFLLGQEILDYPLNSIVIRKVNSVTGELLAGARFQVRKVTEETSGSGGTVIGEYTTDNSGVIVITGLVPGGYIIEEVKAPNNFLLSENSQQQVWLKYDGTSIVEATFANVPYGSILITKVDAQTNKPLANARFRVTDGSGAVAGNTNGEYITDENGEALVANVKPGSYVITEIEAPENYVVDTTPQTVNIGVDGKIYKVSFKNQPAGTLVIRKLDTVTKEPLADAEFKVTTSGGDVVGTSNGIFKTDATGTITIPHLPKGSYIVMETKAPTDYILENQSQTIAIDYGKTYTLDFYNKHMSGLQIIKIDSQTKQPLKGAEFTIYKQSGEIVDRYVTDADGVIIIDTLSPGWYKIVETKTLDGYVLDEVPKDVQITDNQFVKVVFENAPMSSLIIRKVDADTRDPLEGAEFTVKTAGGLLIGIYRSGTDGMVTIPQIAPGWYSVTETKAPDGYTLGDNVQTVEITNTKTVTIEFQNRAFGSLVIKKVDEIKGDPLSGAEFSVYKQGGAFVGEYATGKDGTINIPNVAPGWYVISETKAPTGYILDSTAKTVEVKPVVPSVVTFTNKALSGIEIIKTDSVTHNPLANATFVVEKANGEKIGTYKTDVSGKIIVSDLTEGTYVVSETIAPDGYHLNEIPKTVIVVSGKLTTVEFANKPYSGIQILKTDANTNAPLKGAVFTIQRVNGERVGDKYTTDVAGKIIVSDLEEGVYIISEIQAPAEYVLDAQPQTVEVKSGQLKIVEFVNTPYPYLHIIKTDASTGQLLSGAEFVITNAYGEVIATVISQASGAVSLKVAPGIYTVTEVKAPAGYENNDPVQTVEVRANGSAVYYGTNIAYPNNSAIFANRPLNAIQLLKLDSTMNKPLSKALFMVEKSDGTRIGSFLTDSAGGVLISGLTEGTYIIKEISAPAGYQLDETPKTISISGGGIVTVDFLNKPLSGIQITKLDAVTLMPLKGASFTITKANGEKIGTFRTESDGTAVISDLEEGTYIVSEISAPTGYQLDETPKTVNVVSGRMATIEFQNKPHSGIQIIKTDAVIHAPLANATFTVDRSTGERIGIYRTDAAGQILINDLPEGTYIVSETAAPSGYKLDQTPKTITVVSGRVTTIEFTNAPYGSLVIKKTDEITGRPLAGAHFTVTHQGGSSVGDFITDNDGSITIPNLEPGWYVISETKSPTGYHLDSAAKTIEVQSHAPTSITFTNRPYSGIEIVKIDAVTQAPLSGATFEVTRADGSKIGTYKTDAAGKILVSDLLEGSYIVSEVSAPSGYMLNDTPKTVNVVSGKLASVEFSNSPYGSLIIKKTDEITARTLAGAHFTVKHQNGAAIGDYVTDNDGAITIPNLEPGWYVISETKSPTGYHLDSAAKTIEVTSHAPTSITFTNRPYSGIEIIKTDAVTHAPLAGATFTVMRSNGENISTYKTDASGKIVVSDLTEGTYIISETIAPDNYQLDETPKTVVVTSGKMTTAEFTNKPLSGIEIIKLDAINFTPLSGAIFVVERANGEKIGTYRTDWTGKIIVHGLSEGTYIVSETIAPNGYVIDEMPKTVIVTSGKLTTVEFTNLPLSGIEIIKIDSVTKAPLMGATFVVERPNGEKVGTYKTDISGKIMVSGLSEGTYIVSETAAPYGYQLDETPKTVVVTSGKLTEVEFTNKPHSGIIIYKFDAETKAPLTGATFIVERDNGEKIGTYKTDRTGKIIVNDLTEGTYIVSELYAPDGYILDEAPKTVIVKSGKVTEIEFFNKPLAGIRIIKLDSVTRNPIEGVEFSLNKMNGERVENEFRGYTFKTDRTGQIYIPQLENGYYVVTETRTVDGYILDGEPKTVLVESGKITVLEVLNTPMSSLLIVKTDSVTGKPIAGAVYDIKRADGSFVTGSILDGNQPNTANNSANKTASPNGDITGSYTTDANGRIQINGLDAGQYTVTEHKAPDGYELDTQVYNVTVLPGKMATLQLQNKPMGGIRLTKIDSLTKKPIYNVEFMLFDSSNKVIGVYYTDNNGVIDFPKDIPSGRYTIRETRAAAGYYLDDMPKTVEFVAGQVTEITWSNTPQMGQIQILKKSGDANEINGFAAGTPLSGAVFEVYNYKTGNLVDRFVSGNDGKAVSSPLPLGRYVVKEVQAPKYYKLSDKELDITIEFATEIVKKEYLNYSANTGVSIKKTGNAEAMPGDTIRYDIKEVRNTGTVPLTDFYWRDVLPVDAVRLNKIVTGTYNQSLKYKIMATTNKGNTIIIADNLFTTKNNVVDCSPASLGLKNDEFVTSFTLMFGTVKAGFAQVETPQIYVDVLKTLQNGYKFANKVDCGGKYNGEWVVGNSTTVCTIFSNSKLPKTGF